MDFPSAEWLEELQERCNEDEQFNRAAEWSDVNVVIGVDEERYWLKLYGGEIIDTMTYEPMSNPLGYDVVVSGSKEAWEPVVAGDDTFWKAYSSGGILIDGDLLEANRMHEALVRMAELMAETQQAEVTV
ncbi:hypothetical protein ACFQPA_16185 [Halomarina halobia]|uniref:SCP2 domain-containing protein n=1 Tax=Halomarina halobia TaxID=3033386 RepID=A0ABD6AEZ2_9EURY|nr:hypothetical protein [Halomarina sp. PSR21]